MESKRKRGANYTPQEVKKLLELVKQHRVAIDEKKTSSAFLQRKKEAWEAVCIAYNVVATTGPRTVEQLRTFYDNKKRRTRRVLVEHNKTEFMTHQTIEPESATNETQFKPSLMQSQFRTVAGSDCPTVRSGLYQELKTFDLVWNQITPPPSCESGGYFGNTTHDNEAEEIVVEVALPLADNGVESNDQHPGNSSKQNPSHRGVEPKSQVKKKARPQTKGKPDYKKLYFIRKCHNAYLERKKLNQEIEFRKIEHNLKVKEHLISIQIMQEEYERKMK